MAKLFNLARMTSATTGTGTITLGSAVLGFLTFSQAGVSNGDRVSYGIRDGTNTEIGTGVYTSSGTTLTRSVSLSTNSNAAINLSGNAEVYITALADDIQRDTITPEQYGAKGDVVVKTNGGAITSGTASFTSSTYTFVAADAGKTIAIDGAGAAGVCLVTTISSVSGGAAILATNASTTVTTAAHEWGTDDSAALHSLAEASAGKAVWFGVGKIYYTKDTNGNPNRIRFGSDNFVIYGNSATIRAMPNAPVYTDGVWFSDSTSVGTGPTNFLVQDLFYYGNRTRRISCGAITDAVHGASAFYIAGAQRFNLRGLVASNTIADGLYIGGDTRTGRLSQFFSVEGGIWEDAGRNGISCVGAAYGAFLGGCTQNHSFGSAHGNISYGVDLEPDGSWNSNSHLKFNSLIASSCQTGFGSNIPLGSNTGCVFEECTAEACTDAFFESSAGSMRVFSPSLFGNTTDFTNVHGYVGYNSGDGGAVTQASSRTTGVTLNKPCGSITLVSAAGSTTFASFTVTNSTVAATDTVIVSQKSGTDLYEAHVTAVGAGSFRISFRTTGGTTVEQPVFNFAVIKSFAS